MISLGMLANSPFHAAATSALRKVIAVTDDRRLKETVDLATRVYLFDEHQQNTMPKELATALQTGDVLQITYVDRDGTSTSRAVEPMGYIGKSNNWYLIAWCRLRDDVRAFRGDRSTDAKPTGERPVPRPLSVSELGILDGELRMVGVDRDLP